MKDLPDYTAVLNMKPSEIARLAADLIATGYTPNAASAFHYVEKYLFKDLGPNDHKPPGWSWWDYCSPAIHIEQRDGCITAVPEDRVRSLLHAALILESEGL